MRPVTGRQMWQAAAIALAAWAVSWASASGPVAADAPAVSRIHPVNELRGNHPDRVNVIAEIQGLAKASAADLAGLRKLAAAVDKGEPKDEAARVRFFSGVNHQQHGLLPHGVNDRGVDEATRPPEGRGYSEYHFDAGDRLLAIFWHAPAGGFQLTDKLLYDGDDLVARLTYGKEGFQFGDYGCYRDGKLRLLARIDAKGRLLSYECIFYAADREDCTVRYVYGDNNPDSGRMVLDSVTLADGARLQFDHEGRIREFWAPYPRSPDGAGE